jgi:uncharacterized protein
MKKERTYGYRMNCCLVVVFALGALMTEQAYGCADPPSTIDVQRMKEADQRLREAAQKGDVKAQVKLGKLYEFPDVSFPTHGPNYGEAMKWFRKALAQGSSEAMDEIGTMHQQGWGVQRDPGEAVTWYRKAAQTGDAEGQWNLGLAYEAGSGVKKDDVQACMWYMLSGRTGPKLDNLKKAMTREQVAEAKRLASEWKPSPM